MSQINHIYDIPFENKIENCPKCNKSFYCSEEEQVPGFREMDSKICPYCNYEIEKSMTYEYECRKLSVQDIDYLSNKGFKIDKKDYGNE